MSEKTHSEALFEAYLDTQTDRWEPVIEGKTRRPDYRVVHCGKSCWFEVKEFDDPDPKPSGGFSPSPAIIGKITKARKQFKGVKSECCALVLHNCSSIYRSIQPEAVLSAAFGEHISFGPGFDGLLRDEHFRLKFSGSSQLNERDNTSISAIIILQHYQVDELVVEVYSELHRRWAGGEKVSPFAHAELLAARQDEPRRIRYANSVRVIVLENPHARIPFPEDLFQGPFDQRWRQGPEGFSLLCMGSELKRLRGRNRWLPFFLL